MGRGDGPKLRARLALVQVPDSMTSHAESNRWGSLQRVPETEEMLDNGSGPAGKRLAARPRRRWPWVLASVAVLIAVGLGVWLGIRVNTVRTELEAAQAAVSAVKGGGDTTQALQSIAAHSRAAVTASDDPVWKVSEAVPIVGDNLRAVRLASESLDALTSGLAVPVLDAFGDASGGQVLGRVVPILQSAAPGVAKLSTSVAEVQRSTSLVPQVRAGLDQVAEVLSAASPALELMPEMLGADAPKNYLLVAQSNAESVGLGGSAASQTLIRVEGGTIAIKAQADSSEYRYDTKVRVPVDQSAIDLYHDVMLRNINASVSRPDFPTAAMVLKALWQRDIHDDQIDGVISVDPIALSYVLDATGPIKVGSNGTATSDNIVRLVLSDAYSRYADLSEGDEFFKAVARSVFSKLANGQFDVRKMLGAAEAGISGGSILFWSADPEIQERVATMAIAGILPTDNAQQTVLGVYFRDSSAGSKIDYYMKSAVTATAVCTSEGKSEFTASVTLKLDITQAAADALPDYVKSHAPGWGSKKFSTEVFVYGPPGAELTGIKLGKETVQLRKQTIIDLGRPVASFDTFQRPGTSTTVTATFSGAPGTYGPVKVQTTPMVHTTKVAVDDQRCVGR